MHWIRPIGASGTAWLDSMASALPRLFTPIRIRDCEIKNRIVSTGHDTMMAMAGLPSAAMIAYQQARAEGGAGQISATRR